MNREAPYPTVDPELYAYAITMGVRNGEIEQVIWYSDTTVLWTQEQKEVCSCCGLQKRRPQVGSKAWRLAGAPEAVEDALDEIEARAEAAV